MRVLTTTLVIFTLMIGFTGIAKAASCTQNVICVIDAITGADHISKGDTSALGQKCAIDGAAVSGITNDTAIGFAINVAESALGNTEMVTLANGYCKKGLGNKVISILGGLLGSN